MSYTISQVEKVLNKAGVKYSRFENIITIKFHDIEYTIRTIGKTLIVSGYLNTGCLIFEFPFNTIEVINKFILFHDGDHSSKLNIQIEQKQE